MSTEAAVRGDRYRGRHWCEHHFYNACAWKCCSRNQYSNVNRKDFWARVNEAKEDDDSFDESTMRLIYEKMIGLNTHDDSMRLVLYVGLDPKNQFQVGARIHRHATGEYLTLNSKQFRDLLSFVEFQKEKILNKIKLKNSTASAEKRFKFSIRVNDENGMYELTVNNRSIYIDQLSLIRLCSMREYIQRVKHSLEQQSNKNEAAFFELMGHFCYEKSTVVAQLECDRDWKRDEFFKQIINFHCDCLDKAYVIEIALNCQLWFGLCTPIFIETIMLNEHERFQTFNSDWLSKNNQISGDLMAKSGFYHSGRGNDVICAFCGLLLEDWGKDDIPIIKHFKYRPSCPYLVDHRKTLNISRHTPTKVDEIIQQIEKK